MKLKLAEMTDVDKMQALADLDGLLNHGEYIANCFQAAPTGSGIGAYKNGICQREFPNYLHIYDCVLPLIKKRFKGYQAQKLFLDALEQIIFKAKDDGTGDTIACTPFDMITATPKQLSEALLIAAGKFEL